MVGLTWGLLVLLKSLSTENNTVNSLIQDTLYKGKAQSLGKIWSWPDLFDNTYKPNSFAVRYHHRHPILIINIIAIIVLIILDYHHYRHRYHISSKILYSSKINVFFYIVDNISLVFLQLSFTLTHTHTRMQYLCVNVLVYMCVSHTHKHTYVKWNPINEVKEIYFPDSRIGFLYRLIKASQATFQK